MSDLVRSPREFLRYRFLGKAFGDPVVDLRHLEQGGTLIMSSLLIEHRTVRRGFFQITSRPALVVRWQPARQPATPPTVLMPPVRLIGEDERQADERWRIKSGFVIVTVADASAVRRFAVPRRADVETLRAVLSTTPE